MCAQGLLTIDCWRICCSSAWSYSNPGSSVVLHTFGTGVGAAGPQSFECWHHQKVLLFAEVQRLLIPAQSGRRVF